VTWTVEIARSALRDLDTLPPRIAPAVIEFIYGPLAQNPRRVGKPLRDEFAGLWSARRGAYRVLYELEDDRVRVVVVRISHRADAYRKR
jgi:mRNA-degrading endonuclease RelE of RelBE toxin-antitoxin system